MTEALSLANLRRELGRTWLIALFGIAYIISQITIIIILGPIEDAMVFGSIVCKAREGLCARNCTSGTSTEISLAMGRFVPKVRLMSINTVTESARG